MMKRALAPILALAATMFAAGAAQAGNVQWSVGINLPPIGTVISNGPVYAPAPVYYRPAPVYYEPAPVYYAPPPRVVYRPAPVVYRPVPVVYEGWVPPGHRGHGRGWERRGHHRHGGHDD